MKKQAAVCLALAAAGTLAMSFPAFAEEGAALTIDQIKLGEDYTDLSADLKFLTHKTDVIDTEFQRYIEEFHKSYPNINIEYEGITDYANDVTTRLSTGDWGDICMVPTTVDLDGQRARIDLFHISFPLTWPGWRPRLPGRPPGS